MGITIHYRGRVADVSHIDVAVDTAVAAAERRGWAARRFANARATVPRTSPEREWEYAGPTRGVVITPHEQSEPLCLEFDGDGVVEDFCKTHFAGADTHMAVIELLRELQPALESLEVVDEGEYWETSDRTRLTRLLDDCNEQLAHHLRSNPNVRGPVRLENGRMVDLIEIAEPDATPPKPWWRFW
jgi:hypothetical protein